MYGKSTANGPSGAPMLLRLPAPEYDQVLCEGKSDVIGGEILFGIRDGGNVESCCRENCCCCGPEKLRDACCC